MTDHASGPLGSHLVASALRRTKHNHVNMQTPDKSLKCFPSKLYLHVNVNLNEGEGKVNNGNLSVMKSGEDGESWRRDRAALLPCARAAPHRPQCPGGGPLL